MDALHHKNKMGSGHVGLGLTRHLRVMKGCNTLNTRG